MKLAAWFAALLVGTCAFMPDGARPWTPPAHYRAIWDSAQACTDVRGNFDRITWMRIEGRSFECDGKKGSDIGCWQKPHVITIASDWENIDWVVRHEMVHDLLQLQHDGGDLDRYWWGKRCHAMWGWLDNDPNYRP